MAKDKVKTSEFSVYDRQQLLEYFLSDDKVLLKLHDNMFKQTSQSTFPSSSRPHFELNERSRMSNVTIQANRNDGRSPV